MTTKTLTDRCALSEQCLPDAPYRAMLTALHKDMILEIERLQHANAQLVQAITKTVEENRRLADGDNCTLVHLGWARHFAGAICTPPAQPEPVQDEPFTYYRNYDGGTQDWPDEKTIPLYTTPPAAQRQWVGLTDEERKEIWNDCDPTHAGYVTALVEAKLKEKNT